ncbi:MAG: hypothetical protein ACKOFK_00910 [Betaproteobacteria bacterium]
MRSAFTPRRWLWRSRLHLLVLLAGGAVAGVLLEWRLPLSPA